MGLYGVRGAAQVYLKVMLVNSIPVKKSVTCAIE